MTESDWRACTDPGQMLGALRALGNVSARKVWLFFALGVRGVGPFRGEELYSDDEDNQRQADAFERWAEGLTTWRDSFRVMKELDPFAATDEPPEPSVDSALAGFEESLLPQLREGEVGSQCCTLLRELFGPLLFREVKIDAAWLAWNGGTAPRLAAAAYEERSLPEGTLDPARLTVLADALEEAGCSDAELLGHLRGPGPHVRGCWMVDLLLGKK
jgi:hypothetical protein